MNKIINYLKSFGLFCIILVVYLLIMSLLYYFELLSYNTLSIINFIVSILLFFILGFRVSSLEGKRGYLNGFLIAVCVVILFMLVTFNILFRVSTLQFDLPEILVKFRKFLL